MGSPAPIMLGFGGAREARLSVFFYAAQTLARGWMPNGRSGASVAERFGTDRVGDMDINTRVWR